MGSWRPASLEELQTDICESESRMTSEEAQFWQAIRIEPSKWVCPPYGDEGGGFWAVGVFRNNVLWYNDIEDGFNFSRYAEFGHIRDYFCNQSDLRDSIRTILDALEDRDMKVDSFGPPKKFAE